MGCLAVCGAGGSRLRGLYGCSSPLPHKTAQALSSTIHCLRQELRALPWRHSSRPHLTGNWKASATMRSHRGLRAPPPTILSSVGESSAPPPPPASPPAVATVAWVRADFARPKNAAACAPARHLPVSEEEARPSWVLLLARPLLLRAQAWHQPISREGARRLLLQAQRQPQPMGKEGTPAAAAAARAAPHLSQAAASGPGPQAGRR